MKANQDYILFAVREYYRDKVSLNGEDLKLDPSFDPTKHAGIKGVAVQVPASQSGKPIMIVKDKVGLPVYGPKDFPADYIENNVDVIYSPEKPSFYRVHDIVQEVLPGDVIYFHYNTLLKESNFVADDLVDLEGEKFDLWKVRLDQVICTVRPRKKKKQGWEIIMIGGWCLVEPDMETWDEILRPTYYPFLDPHTGKNKLRPKQEWLVTKTQPEKYYLKGHLRHVGTPLRGDTCSLKKDDYIVYTPNADFEVEIEGRTYFAIRQHHIEGVFTQQKKGKLVRAMP